MTSPSVIVNLLDLAAASVASTIVAADTIKKLSDPESEGKNTRLKDDGSFVTDADLAAQVIIVSALRNVSTDVRIVGEESAEDTASHRVNIKRYEGANESMFRLAQQEILLRYNRSNGAMPLAQTVASEANDVTSAAVDQENDGISSASLIMPCMEQYQVEASRISVFIDPLDGTKAYARGDYEPVSILIAIILDGRPCFGVIGKPYGYRGQTSILDTGCVAVYGGTLLGGVFTAGGGICTLQRRPDVLPRAVISGSRSKGVVQDFVSHLGSKGMIDPEPMLISGAGEKSLRIVLRTENEGLWFFPKAGTSLWDVAASDALLRAIGGKLTDKYGQELDYSKSRADAENEDGVVACYDDKLHAECIRLFLEGTWIDR